MNERWDSEKIVRAVKAVVGKRMKGAMLVLQGDVQSKISRGQPVVRSGKSLRGLDPSKEGEFPKGVTFKLRTSITHRVDDEGDTIVGRVGTNVPYARRLELGFFGTDSRGSNINQGARPYLRPALAENLGRLAKMLVG